MPPTFTHGYALLIGVDENHVSRYALPDVAKDIQTLAQVLIHPQRCAYPEGNVKTLTGQETTRQGILDGLEWLQERIQADTSDNTTAIVYYTGHGWHTNSAGSSEFYLIPYDVREGKIKSRALRAFRPRPAVHPLVRVRSQRQTRRRGCRQRIRPRWPPLGHHGVHCPKASRRRDRMEKRLIFKYDRAADILYIDKTPPYPEQETEELIDIFLLMENPFDARQLSGETALIFDHIAT